MLIKQKNITKMHYPHMGIGRFNGDPVFMDHQLRKEFRRMRFGPYFCLFSLHYQP